MPHMWCSSYGTVNICVWCEMTKQMYSFVNKTWTPVGGRCPIQCPYCLVNSYKLRFPAIAAKYSGEPRLVGPWPRFKKGDVVFVCHMTDLFAMPKWIIGDVLKHCRKWPDADYIFQTKHPGAILRDGWLEYAPPIACFGTTIETDLTDIGLARDDAMFKVMEQGYKTFITVEPIMQFTPAFAQRLIDISPSFVNIGAESKRHNLPEPTGAEIRQLIADLRAARIEVREKPNLERLMKTEGGE